MVDLSPEPFVTPEIPKKWTSFQKYGKPGAAFNWITDIVNTTNTVRLDVSGVTANT